MRRLAFIVAVGSLAFAPVRVLADTPLLGTWVLNGGEPRPTSLQSFTITRLVFRRDHRVEMRYLPEPPAFSDMLSRKEHAESIAPRTDTVTYIDRGGGKLEFASGSSLIEFKYQMRSSPTLDLLLLHGPPELGSVAKIYRRVK